jgi:hypothetical protein
VVLAARNGNVLCSLGPAPNAISTGELATTGAPDVIDVASTPSV